MLVSKMVQIEFTDSSIQAADAIYDIRKAAESASINLNLRYDVVLQYPMLADENKVVVELKIPEEIVDTFSVGNHLRGISTYLLKRCGGRYDKYLVGKRLLNYIEIPTPEVKTDKLPIVKLARRRDFAVSCNSASVQAPRKYCSLANFNSLCAPIRGYPTIAVFISKSFLVVGGWMRSIRIAFHCTPENSRCKIPIFRCLR